MPKQDRQLRGDRLHDDDNNMCNNMEELALARATKNKKNHNEGGDGFVFFGWL